MGRALATLILFSGCADPEVAAIQEHLQQVENELRAAPMPGLTATQVAARVDNIEALARYRERGLFPHNHVHASPRQRPVEVVGAYGGSEGAIPVFVDDHGTHCAVGYLMRESGAAYLASQISAQDNLAYVHEIEAEGLGEWTRQSGLTVDELARIQPSYQPSKGEVVFEVVSYSLMFANVTVTGTSVTLNIMDPPRVGWYAAGAGIGAFTLAYGLTEPSVNQTSNSLGTYTASLGDLLFGGLSLVVNGGGLIARASAEGGKARFAIAPLDGGAQINIRVGFRHRSSSSNPSSDSGHHRISYPPLTRRPDRHVAPMARPLVE